MANTKEPQIDVYSFLDQHPLDQMYEFVFKKKYSKDLKTLTEWKALVSSIVTE